MQGSNHLAKELNSLMTVSLVGRYDIPEDECVNYAEEFAKLSGTERDMKALILDDLKNNFERDANENVLKKLSEKNYGINY